MISSMSKYTFLIYHEEYLTFLDLLRNTGVVHIQEKADGLAEDEALNEKMKLHQKINDSIKLLKARKVDAISPAPTHEGAPELIDRIEKLTGSLENERAKLHTVLKKWQQVKPWGPFSIKTIEQLKEAGCTLHFFSCSKSKFDEQWRSDYQLFEINRVGSQIYFVLVNDTPEAPVIEAELQLLPDEDVQAVESKKNQLDEKIESLEHELDQVAASAIPLLAQYKEHINSELDFQKVVLNAGNEAENRLKILEGWVPDEQIEELEAALLESGAYYLRSEAGINDQVPVKLKNNAFTSLFEMIGSLYSLPNYRELDLTPFFAPFFMLFFGFCLGDAGYGLLMLAATLILRAKAKPAMKGVWTLGFLFGIATVIMGLVSGTLFGVELVKLDIPWLEQYQRMVLNQNQLMYFAVALGLIQIIFGICLKAARAIKMYGIKHALSTIGWVIILVGVGGSFGLMKMETLHALTAKYLMIAFGSVGGVLALFFNSPGKNVLINFGLGLWDTYGTVTGLLGDVLSYIRLFALGLSSAVLGNVFNQLAFSVNIDLPVVKQLIILIILLLGHSINFFMAALGAFVHPLRLTFVEFYKNTGFAGGGKKYSPFRKMEEALNE